MVFWASAVRASWAGASWSATGCVNASDWAGRAIVSVSALDCACAEAAQVNMTFVGANDGPCPGLDLCLDTV